MNKNILSIDAETNGLWGKAFSIGAILYGENGQEKSFFLARCPIEGETDSWVEKNVIPQMLGIPETNATYEEMLEAFSKFYKENKEDATLIVHMGLPVEAKLFLDAHTLGFIGDFDAPYPLIDVSATLDLAGFDPTSVDKYNKALGIEVPDDVGGTHNPLYDSRAAALCYMDLKNRNSNQPEFTSYRQIRETLG